MGIPEPIQVIGNIQLNIVFELTSLPISHPAIIIG